MFILYARPGAGSAAIEALLALLKQPYTVEDVPREPDGGFPGWFRKLNPRAQIPTLKLPDGSVMTESGAMMIHLADLVPSAGLAPAPGASGRAQYLRWMLFLAASIYPADLRYFYPQRYSTDPSQAADIKEQAGKDMDVDYAILAQAVGEGPYVLGKTFSAVDVYAAMLISWAADVNVLFRNHPGLKRLYDAVAAQPGVRAVWDRNGMP